MCHTTGMNVYVSQPTLIITLRIFHKWYFSGPYTHFQVLETPYHDILQRNIKYNATIFNNILIVLTIPLFHLYTVRIVHGSLFFFRKYIGFQLE